MICGVSNEEIIKEINKHIIFETVCKIKSIDYESIIGDLINRIKDSEIDDKDALIGIQETLDEECMNVIREEDVLFIENTMLMTKEEAIVYFTDDDNYTEKYYRKMESELKYFWIETTDEEKKVIKIAIECGLEEIRVEIM